MRFSKLTAAIFGAVLLAGGAHAMEPGLADMEVVDLTHPLNKDAVFWPTSPTKFELTELAHGETEGGWFYSS